MIYSSKLEDLLKDGYTRKFADYYLGQARDYETLGVYDKEYSQWALSHGFLADSAYWYGLTESNYTDFLPDYQYYRVWPLNNWTRIWINDKMSLKLFLGDTEFGHLMPDYYYYSTPEGLQPLPDNPLKKRIHEGKDFLTVLREVKDMACKPCNGTSSIGFFHLSYVDNTYCFNDKAVEAADVLQIVNSHPNYVFTEYLRPSGYLGQLSDKIHTLRLVVINPQGKEPKIIGGYLRIPTPTAGAANYTHLEGNRINDYNIVADVNPNSGRFGETLAIYVNKAVRIDTYPGNGLSLNGIIEHYEVLKSWILGIADRYRTLEYLGYDLCVSASGFKCMEINTHPGIRHMQIWHSFLSDPYTREYFEKKIDQIDRMSDLEKMKRNTILR